MKNQWILCAALCAGLTGADALGTSAPQGDGRDLEAVVRDLQREVDTLRQEVEDSKRVTRETVAYLQSVSKTAKSMSATLDSAEEKGFTAGINPASRETLLSGWRDQLGALQKNVPSLEPVKREATEAGGKR